MTTVVDERVDSEQALTRQSFTLPDQYANLEHQIGAGLDRLRRWFPLQHVSVEVGFTLYSDGRLWPKWIVHVSGGPHSYYASTLKAAMGQIDSRRASFIDEDELNALLNSIEPTEASAEEWAWLHAQQSRSEVAA